jgi:HTH-type transcriptional regulator / antitoxin HigA
MKRLRKPINFEQLPKDYAELCKRLMPRPIRDKIDFENVTEVADVMAGHKLSPDQIDYFNLLCRLIEDYEREHLPTPKVSGLDALRHLLDEDNMGAADLSRLLGVHRTLGGMILRGERKLTVDHVRTLSLHFGVTTDLFLLN